MTKIELQFKNKIMRRVYAVWLLKKVLSLSFLRSFIILIVLFKFAQEVSVLDVFNNMPNESFYSNYNYFTFAFSHTELSVQVYVLIMFSIAIWLIVEYFGAKLIYNKKSI